MVWTGLIWLRFFLVGSEVRTATVMKISIYRLITPCSPLKVNRRLALLVICFHAGFLLGLFFNPENGGDMFLRNFGWFSTDYKALYSWRQNSSYLVLVHLHRRICQGQIQGMLMSCTHLFATAVLPPSPYIAAETRAQAQYCSMWSSAYSWPIPLPNLPWVWTSPQRASCAG
jgi:hypothetical protein